LGKKLIIETGSVEHSRLVAKAVASVLEPGSVVGLIGILGAGKTEFVRGMVSGLKGGESIRVHSPSFSIVEEYGTKPKLVHVDLYRISDPEELETTGLEDVVESRDSIAAIEWFDVARDFGLPPALVVEIGIGQHDDSRLMEFSSDDPKYEPVFRTLARITR